MNTKIEPERLLTIQQAAEITSYDEATILRWLSQGLRHCTGDPGRMRPRRKNVRIKASDLWSFVDSITIARSAPAPKVSDSKRKLPANPGGAGGLSTWRQPKGER
jgi:hypothetical protein